MSRFVLTAQLQLQAPTNTRQVVAQIQRQLQGGVNLNVNVQNAGRSQRQLQQLNQQVNNLNTAGQRMGRTFGVALRRFTAFAIASRGVSLFTNSLGNAISEAIDFERELVKVSQVTGKTMKELDGLTNTISNLSVTLGVSSKELLSTTRILAQAGIRAGELDVALEALAKTSLSATFEDIGKTAEGAVALVAQFGQGVGALEKQLSQISSVAGQFAVESGDLISAIRRTGGVFVSAGGELEEFLGLFTSIRATTRESAESIATGLRTILTRIQRPKTIEYLRQFGVELTDLTGKFVGPYEAVRRLSEAFAGLDQGDITFVRVAEELGGFRQIGKVIPLIQQFETAERARQAAIAGGESLTKDAITAQQALAIQFTKVREEFLALVRGISETGTFQILTKTALQLTSQLIKLADAFKPLLPLIGAFAAFRLARGAGNFLSGVGAGLRNINTRNMGGPIGFATGGVVPGTGNRDTVPAMLTPGEFVIRKSSVNKIGAGTLAAMNENRYAGGGKVSDFSDSRPYVKTNQETFWKKSGQPFLKTPSGSKYATKFNPDDSFEFELNREYINLADKKYAAERKKKSELYSKYRSATDPRIRGILFEDFLTQTGIVEGANRSNSRLDGKFQGLLTEIKSRKDKVPISEIGKKVIGGAIDPKSNIDDELADVLQKKSLTDAANNIKFQDISLLQDATALQKFAKGGSPSDTVPALLTPGEFVINKEAASRIGKANLETMNKKGVAGFAAGGSVGTIQRFEDGGGVDDNSPDAYWDAVANSVEEAAKRAAESWDSKAMAIKTEISQTNAQKVQAEEAQQRDASNAKREAATQNELDLTVLQSLTDRIPELKDALSGNTDAITANDLSQASLREQLAAQKEALAATSEAYYKAAEAAEGPNSVRSQEQPGIDQRKNRIQAIDQELKSTSISDERRAELKTERGIAEEGIAKRENKINASEEFLRELEKQIKLESDAIDKSKEALIAGEIAEQELTDQRKELSKALAESITTAKSLKEKTTAYAQSNAQTGTQGDFKSFSTMATGVETKAKAASDEKFKKEAAAADMRKTMMSGAKKTSDKTDCDLCAEVINLGYIMQEVIHALDHQPIIRKTLGDIARLIAKGKFGSGGGSDNKKETKEPVLPPEPTRAAPPVEEDVVKKGNEAEKQDARTSKSIALLAALNLGLANFIRSEEEAAKNTFNLANALQAGITQFIAVREAMAQVKDFADTQLTEKSGSGTKAGVMDLFSKKGREKFSSAELSKESGLGQFFRNRQAQGKKLERRAAGIQSRGGGRLQNLAGKGLSKLGSGLGKAAGFASKFAAVGLKAIPVVGQIAGAITSFSSALSAGFAFQAKYNQAIKDGNVAKAQEYAALKDFTGIEQGLALLNPAFGEASAFIRGTTIESLKSQAKYAALVSKADLEKADNARLASDALKEVAEGTTTLRDALAGDLGNDFRNALESQSAAKDANRLAEGDKSRGITSLGRDLLSSVSFGFAENTSERNVRIEGEQKDRTRKAEEATAAEFEKLMPQINQLGRDAAAGGKTLQQFEAQLLEMGYPIDEVKGASERVAKAFANNEKSLERNRKAFEALNFGLVPLLKTGQGLNSVLGSLTSVSDGTYNALSNAKNVLQTAATGGVVDDAAFQSALDVVTKDLTAFGGGAQVEKITQTISALRTGFEGAGPALEKFRQGLISGEIDGGSPTELREGLANVLTADIKDANAKKIIQDALADVELDPKEVEKIISDGDMSGLFKILEEKGQEAFKELGPVIDNLINAQNSLLNLTNKRIAAEQELINAQLNSADLQKEAANLIAEFSNKTLSGDEQANLAAGRLRATGINTQDAGALSATLAFNTARQQANTASLSATGDAALSGQDRASTEASQQNMATQNAEILTYARERVKIYQQEIAAAKNKLKLDQDAAKSLLSGDISKFSENINASIAADAFRSGDTSMLSGLSGEALSAGFDALSDEEKAASAGTLESLGISSGLADAAAGTSPEIEALQAEATKYAEIIAQSGDSSVQLATAALTAAENLETLGRAALAEAERKAAEKQAELDAEKKKSEEALAKQEAEKQAQIEKEKAAEAAETKRREEAAIAEEKRLEQGSSYGAALNDYYGEGAAISDQQRKEFDKIYKEKYGGNAQAESMEYAAGGMSSFLPLSAISSESTRSEMLNSQGPAGASKPVRQIGGGTANPFDNWLVSMMMNKGGTVYASRGMFIPRGTDTVPAMLTPGEFVVNRAAVQRGNNLQILRAMNGGDTGSNGAPAPSAGEGVAMARGGMVKYFNEGGEVGGGMSEFVTGFSQAIGQLGSAFGTFAQSVENLSNMKLSVSLAPTSVDVNVMGPLLSELSEQTKEIVLNAVVSEIKLNQLGNLERTV